MIVKEKGWYKVDNGEDLVVSFESKNEAKKYHGKVRREWKGNAFENFLRNNYGFAILRCKGDHKIMVNPNGVKIPVTPNMNAMVARKELKNKLGIRV